VERSRVSGGGAADVLMVRTASQLRPFSSCGLQALDNLEQQLEKDRRRCGASIGLLCSGSSRLSASHRLAQVRRPESSQIDNTQLLLRGQAAEDHPERWARAPAQPWGSELPVVAPQEEADHRPRTAPLPGALSPHPEASLSASSSKSQVRLPGHLPELVDEFGAGVGFCYDLEGDLDMPLPPPRSESSLGMYPPRPESRMGMCRDMPDGSLRPESRLGRPQSSLGATRGLQLGSPADQVDCTDTQERLNIQEEGDEEEDEEVVHEKEKGSEPPSPRPKLLVATQNSIWVTLNSDGDGSISLEEAYELHSYNFDADGDGTMGLEEIMLLLERCKFFDEFLTHKKARVYLLTWEGGCNHVVGLGPTRDSEGFGYEEFERLLQWVADIKMVPFDRLAGKVVALSSQICDKSSSVRRKLEVVFQTYAVQEQGRMSVFEFAALCSKSGLYERGRFCTGDAHQIYHRHRGCAESIEFDGFLAVLTEVGRYSEAGAKIRLKVASHCDSLKADEAMQSKLRLKMRVAACAIEGREWEHFFRNVEADGSGSLTWEQFYKMCRLQLHLLDHDNHLRTLFSRLDTDICGEIAVEELISFVSNDERARLARSSSMIAKAAKYSEAFEVDVKAKTWLRIEPPSCGQVHSPQDILPGSVAHLPEGMVF